MGKSLKGKELGRGITQRKDKLYQARFTDSSGKTKTIYAKTYKEILQTIEDQTSPANPSPEQPSEAQPPESQPDKSLSALIQAVQAKDFSGQDITLNDWYEIWINTCKKNCRDTTLRTYSLQYNRLRDTIGALSLPNLNPILLQTVFNNLKSDASRNACKKLLVDILNCAMEADLIAKNPALNIKTKIDNIDKPEKRVLTEEEIQLLYKTSRNDRLYPFFAVALNTGMRIGEIIGLTWDCVDFENSIIKVEKTLCYLPNNGNGIYEFHPPKTKAGRRVIPMTKQAKEALQEQRKWQSGNISGITPLKGFEKLVFTSKTNRPLHAANIQDSIKFLIKKINKQNPEINFKPFTPHCLRHTFATNCIAKGMRPKTLQKLLGHNSLQMTMDLYCHVLEDTLKEEMAMIAEMD